MKIKMWFVVFVIIICILIIFPFFIYAFNFYEFGLSKNNANWGSFGSYISGVTGLITTIMTSISVFVLYYTLKITSKYNQKQIENNHSQTKIEHIDLLVNLTVNEVEKTSNSYGLNKSNLDLVDSFISELNLTMSMHAEAKKYSDDRIVLNYNKGLGLYMEKNGKNQTDEFIINAIKSSQKHSMNRMYIANVSPIVCKIVDMINDEHEESDLKYILTLLLKNKIHNDVILFSLIYCSSNTECIINNMQEVCKIPSRIKSSLQKSSFND
ncbi:hypothetical protein AB7X05_21825 [Providencia rettgeri]